MSNYTKEDNNTRSGWVFAWLPVRCGDTERVVWLRKVFREQWGRSKYYYETANPF